LAASSPQPLAPSPYRSGMDVGGITDKLEARSSKLEAAPPVHVAEAMKDLYDMGDAPSCHTCGAIMVRNGSCYRCMSCGSTSGCSWDQNGWVSSPFRSARQEEDKYPLAASATFGGTMALEEADLLRLLHSTEHTFAERKTSGDHKDWVKTVVAFANTFEPSVEGVLFIGVTDEGKIEVRPANLDQIQKKFSEKMQSAYPPIYYTTKIVSEGGRECLAIIVPGSPAKPHFAGHPYLRDGSQTITPDTARYEALLAARLSKTQELQRWIERSITIRFISRREGMPYQLDQSAHDARVVSCNQFYVAVVFNNQQWSYPLSRLELAYDHRKD
jgi:Putative DNA-binding domain